MQIEGMTLTQDIRSEAEEYLQGLQELTRQMDRAMEAIVTRSLPTFEECIHQQRMTCARMAEVASSLGAGSVRDPSSPTRISLDADLAARIEAAAVTLGALHRRYWALLKHSGETMQLFARLFRSYGGLGQPVTGMQPHRNTWSC